MSLAPQHVLIFTTATNCSGAKRENRKANRSRGVGVPPPARPVVVLVSDGSSS